jgi:drug/metabolite transporter (DMT)-like permease
MFTNNLIGLLISGTIYIATVIFYNEDTHLRILKNPNILFDCVMVGLSGSIGQIFIFLTVSLFDCYLLTVITTTRKFFSVVYSNFRFGHNFN